MSRLFLFILILFTLPSLGQISSLTDWENLGNKFLQKHVRNGAVDYQAIHHNPEELNQLMEFIETQSLNINEHLSAYINAYNLLVISQIIDAYPIPSVKSKSDFFKTKSMVLGKETNLDDLEKSILSVRTDGTIHMALVCGAKSCPPLAAHMFNQSKLDTQLYEHTKSALTQEQIISIDPASKHLRLSKIFQWYSSDFGPIHDFLTTYKIHDTAPYTIKYMDYDWSLNQAGSPIDIKLSSSSDLRYFASNLYTKGSKEVNWFNNSYTQVEINGIRSNFFSSFLQVLIGTDKRLNYGFDIKLRSVTLGPDSLHSSFEALKFQKKLTTAEDQTFKRWGITQVGPKVKYQPFRTLSNITLQHSLHIPVLFDSEGGNGTGYIDWGSPSLFTDVFYDQELGQKASLFLQLGIYGENLGGAFLRQSDGYWQFSTPVTTIINYFITEKATIYGLVNSAPNFGYSVTSNGQSSTLVPNHYNQYGIGFKYFVTPTIQAEVLATHFSSSVPGRVAATYNFGVRYFDW